MRERARGLGAMRYAVEGFALVWLVLGSMTQTSGCQEHAGVSPSTLTLEQVSVTARKHPDATGNREEGVQSGNVQEYPPFEVAWRSIEGLRIRYAMNGGGGETVVLFSPWPESIFAFTPIWTALTKRFQVIAIDLPGFGRSEARDDLFAPQRMGAFITKAIEAFGKHQSMPWDSMSGRLRSSSPPLAGRTSSAAWSWAREPRRTPSSWREISNG